MVDYSRRHVSEEKVYYSLKLNDEPIERVAKFQYLDKWFHENTDQSIEIRTYEKARHYFPGMRKINFARRLFGISYEIGT